jgi:hypothetical protein
MNQLDMAVTKTYSLTMQHIGKVADMAEKSGLSQGEIIRRAIDLLDEHRDLLPVKQVPESVESINASTSSPES